MDDAPYTGDLDLGAVSTCDDLAALLRTVHIRADKPSLRTLEARTRHSATPLSKTAVAEMLKGTRFPRKSVMVSFLRACGVADDGMELWRRTWERVAAGEEGTTRREAIEAAPSPGHAFFTGQHSSKIMTGPVDAEQAKRVRDDRTSAANSPAVYTAGMRRLQDQIRQLTSDNDRLRAQLAATQQQTTEQIRPDDVTSGQRPRSPVVSRRELGALLSALRAEKGMTLDQVAKHLLCSPNKVRRMETGFRSGTVRDVRDLCDLYTVTDAAQRERMMRLAHESKQQGWWQSHDLDFGTYVGLEEAAVATKYYQSTIIPGVLQTADYARAVHEVVIPRLLPDRIEELVEVRMIRQRRLTQDNPPRFTAVLDEAALHRMVGGRRVMAAQLDKILEMSALPNVAVQILPYQIGAHPAMESNFIIIELPPPTPGVVFVEGLIGALYLEQPDDLDRYHVVFEQVQAIALNPKDTIELITSLAWSCKDD